MHMAVKQQFANQEIWRRCIVTLCFCHKQRCQYHYYSKRILFWENYIFSLKVECSAVNTLHWRIQGVQAAHRLRVPILSFWHTNFKKNSCVGNWCTLRGWRPLRGKSWNRHCMMIPLVQRVILILPIFLQCLRTKSVNDICITGLAD